MPCVDVWLLIIAVATLLATIGAIWAARQYGYRRGRLVIDAGNVRLLPASFLSADGEVIIAPMRPPIQYAVQLRLRNLSRSDVSAEDFKDKALRLSFGLDFVVHQLHVEGGFGAPPLEMPKKPANEIRLPPLRIPKKTDWRWTAHVVNPEQSTVEPYVSAHSPIHDAQLKVRIHRSTAAPAFVTLGIGRSPHRFGRSRWLDTKNRVDYY